MIQMTKEQLASYNNAGSYKDLDKFIEPVLQHRKELYERYSRKTTPYEMMGGSMNKTIIAFEYYIVKMVKGYLSGKAPMYNIVSEEDTSDFSDKIDYIRRYNDDGATFTELMHDYLCTAAAYLYVYENEFNEIVYTRLDARQTVGIFDYSTPANLIGAARKWAQSDEKNNVIWSYEIITETERKQYIDGRGLADSETLSWNDVPCVAIEEPDGIAVFEPALTSIDAYEQIINNMRNMTQYNDEAKLLLINYVLPQDENDNKETQEKLYKSKVLAVNADGDIKWLLKQVDYNGLLDVVTQLHEQVTMLTGVPNMTDVAFSNADNASALGYKLYALDQYSADTDRVFRKGYLRLWEVITNRLNLKGSARSGAAVYDFRNIDIIMQRNIPTDKDKSIDRAARMKSSGLFSDETCINETHIEVDAKDEMARRDAEDSVMMEKVYDRPEIRQ